MAHDEDNRRIHPRIDARILVKFKTDDEFTTCYSHNISQGGIYLETEKLPDPNANIDIVLDLSEIDEAKSSKELHLVGRVVRLMTVMIDTTPKHSVALQFIDVPPQTQVVLDEIYDKLSKKEA
jgi:hypothetical protein